jgi:hypothetical protein
MVMSQPLTILDLFEKHEYRPARQVGSFQEAGGIAFSMEGGPCAVLNQREDGRLQDVLVLPTRKSVHVPCVTLKGYHQDILNTLTKHAWGLAESILRYKDGYGTAIARVPDPDMTLLDFTKAFKGPKVLTAPDDFVRVPFVLEIEKGPLGVLQHEGPDFQGSLGLLMLGSRLKCLQVFSWDEWEEVIKEEI